MEGHSHGRGRVRTLANLASAAALAITLALAPACSNPPSAPPPVSVSVTPGTATVNAGLTVQFAATVTNSTNQAVTWSVSGGAGNGTITASGLYTAPATPPGGAVTVTAVAQADSTKSATATVTVNAAVGVAVTPATATVNAGLSQQFAATVTNNANQSVTWSVNGGASNGTITATGLYTAPATPPGGAVTVTAVAQADPTKSGAATVTVNAAVGVAVTPATATVNAGLTQQFAATVANNANQAVTWSVNGGAGNGTITAAGLYTAPAAPPAGAVTVTATAAADPTKSGTATVTVQPAVSVTVTPNPATVNLGLTQQFSAAVGNNSNQSVTWSVNGGASNGTITASGLYTPPATAPTGAVTVTATAAADTTKSGTATVTVAPAVTVTISPSSAKFVVNANASQQYTATVGNTSDQSVTWSVDGVVGGNAALGQITTQGVYTAPLTPPLGGGVNVTATSALDPTKSAVEPTTVAFDNASLTGPFVMSVSGYDANNKYFTALARLTLDGQTDGNGDGHITGSEEVVSNGVFTASTALAAGCCTYQVLSDGRGQISITGPAGTNVYALSMSGGQSAALTDFDAKTSVQGALSLQDQTALSSVGGNYVFGGSASIGLLQVATTSGGGGAIGGSLDAISGGSLLSDLAVIGTYTLGASGWGRAAWSTSQGAVTYDFYVVDAGHWDLMSTSGGSPSVAVVTAQSGAPSALSGPFVFTINGATGANPAGPLGATGQFVVNGGNQVTDGVVDGVVGGAAITDAAITSGTATAGKNAGEFSLALAASSASWNSSFAIWMASPTDGQILEADANGTARGAITAQTGGPFTAASLDGQFSFRAAGSPMTPSFPTLAQGWLRTASGQAAGTLDFLASGVQVPDQVVSGTYTLGDLTHGRFTLTLTDSNIVLPNSKPMTLDLVGYLISPAANSNSPQLGGALLTQGDSSSSWSGQIFQQY